jgi:hypothetical protein
MSKLRVVKERKERPGDFDQDLRGIGEYPVIKDTTPQALLTITPKAEIDIKRALILASETWGLIFESAANSYKVWSESKNDQLISLQFVALFGLITLLDDLYRSTEIGYSMSIVDRAQENLVKSLEIKKSKTGHSDQNLITKNPNTNLVHIDSATHAQLGRLGLELKQISNNWFVSKVTIKSFLAETAGGAATKTLLKTGS